MSKNNDKSQEKIANLDVETVDYDEDVELLISCSGCFDEIDQAPS